jgi:ribose 5-phosphate isomerase B
MRIIIGCDHAGFEIKQLLKEAMHKTLLKRNPETTFQDIGCHSTDSVHYPEIAKTVASGVVEKEADYGLLICGTGIGMCMVANKVNGIRAALCHDPYTSMMARQHNDANILCMGARVLTPYQAINIAQTFFETDFLGGRHEVRVKMID